MNRNIRCLEISFEIIIQPLGKTDPVSRYTGFEYVLSCIGIESDMFVQTFDSLVEYGLLCDSQLRNIRYIEIKQVQVAFFPAGMP